MCAEIVKKRWRIVDEKVGEIEKMFIPCCPPEAQGMNCGENQSREEA